MVSGERGDAQGSEADELPDGIDKVSRALWR